MEVIIQTILLTIITGLLASIGLFIKNSVKKLLNERDMVIWKVLAIDAGCVKIGGDEYETERNKKYEDLIEEDELKNKKR